MMLRRAFSSTPSQGGDALFIEGMNAFRNSIKSEKADKVALAKTLLHWTNASEAGHIKATAALGHLYHKGHQSLLAPNIKMATHFLIKASDGGHANSAYKLGCIYAEQKKEAAAQEQFHRAADSETDAPSLLAALELGNLYEQNSNASLAFKYYKQAGPLPEGKVALGRAHLHGVVAPPAVNNTKALKYFKAAADMGSLEGHLSYAMCLATGRGVKNGTPERENYEKAAESFIIAAEGGSPEAQLVLAQWLEEGKVGNGPNYDKALKYYKMAVETLSGHEDVTHYAEMKTVAVDSIERLENGEAEVKTPSTSITD